MPNCTDEPRNDREITEFCKFWIEVIYFFQWKYQLTSRAGSIKVKIKKVYGKSLKFYDQTCPESFREFL